MANLEFSYPNVSPTDTVLLEHAVSTNVPNRRMIKTIRRTVSAGGIYNFRNVGREVETLKVDIALATKEEARAFTDFFKDVIKGSSEIFLFKDNISGQELIVRSLLNELVMGEAEGHPYSFSLLLKIEDNPFEPIVGVPLEVFMHDVFTSYILREIGSKLLYTCGNGYLGVMGSGDDDDRPVFDKIGTDTDWSYIAPGKGGFGAAYIHCLAVKEGDTLYSTGANAYGQLGLGDLVNRDIFTKISDDVWLDVSAGHHFSTGIKSDGTLWAWGRNELGQLGQGTSDASTHPDPLQVGAGTDWVKVSAGSKFVLAIKSDGTLWSWGLNDYGQLGQNFTSSFEHTPTQIGSDTDWSILWGGRALGFAIKNNGTLWSWGRNARGSLGINNIVDPFVLTPQQVGSSQWSTVRQSGSTASTACGIKLDGTLWVWGGNDAGQLGNGSTDTENHPAPEQVESNSDWTDIALCSGSIIGVRAFTNPYGWGSNILNVLGIIGSPTVPTPIFTPPSNTKVISWELEA